MPTTRKKPTAAAHVFMTAVLGAFAAQWINFVPSQGAIYFALGASVLLAFLVVGAIWRYNGFEGKNSLLYAGAFPVVALSCFWTIAITLYAIPAAISGRNAIVESIVLEAKTSSRFYRCSHALVLDGLSAPLKPKICVSEHDWKMAVVGRKVLVSVVPSFFGVLVKEIFLPVEPALPR
jgi:hypothetical protein